MNLAFAEGEQQEGTVQIINTFGQVVQTLYLSATQTQRMDIAALQAGSYCLRVQTQDGMVSTKCFVKIGK